MDQDDDIYLSFWGHVEELRTALLSIAAVIMTTVFLCFFYSQNILDFLQSPIYGSNVFSKAFSDGSNVPNLVLLSPLEGILMSLKVSFFAAVVVSSPLWLFLIARFILPALRSHEKRLAIFFVIVSFCFAMGGIFFAFYITIPLANQYLLSFNQGLGTNMWSLENYLNYTLFLMLANGVAFELGAIGIFAVKLKTVTLEMLVSKRRHAIVFAIILGALLTPPDILTQILLAVPLILLYEGLILYARILKSFELKTHLSL